MQQHHTSALSNRGPILEVIKLLCWNKPYSTAMEIGSGTGAHLELFAQAFPQITWQPTEFVPPSTSSSEDDDRAYKQYGKIGSYQALGGPLQTLDANLARFPNVRKAVELDVTNTQQHIDALSANSFDLIHAGNLLHVAPFPSATDGFFKVASRALKHEHGALTLYGPFKRSNTFVSSGDSSFDAMLREKNAQFGLRDLESEVLPIAEKHGFKLQAMIQMPANNLLLVFSKQL